ncbi:MAG: fructosamine kinase family protein [Bacteroidetes bacterium]|nr:fructosamine kinase family protein [Bacteroidota bacterium]MBU1116856.1 fructosamine kinase family protein [Bacteroidota bacterium]MBU1797466.1 fructosamine kinase family protein [Bacteroidota bacterium]
MLSKIENIIGEKIISKSFVSGGSIANSQILETESGDKYFIKSYGNNQIILQNEANGLRELAKPNVIKVPEVIAIEDDFLLMEFIETGKKNSNFFELFGQQFAKLHKSTSKMFGFYENNFIGSNPQINLPEFKNWNDFFWTNRLLYQFKLAEQNGFTNSEFRSRFNKLEKQLPSILSGTKEKPSLLHGDLWSGNFMVDGRGNPVLIDPAVYYGHREADLAMTKMFGGFTPAFYSAYNEAYPLPDNWEYRIDFYKLYHVLNHLNLFGSSYYLKAISILDKYTSGI